ncbi:hypothetical protein PTHTG4_04530 [Parageobacillus thermoglucosidasius]|nr:hypothetical protein Geoth_0667 [Parageobacillus thermoglucosidasius C56-YS93]GCD81391.1 hypothetical protein PTHTG4_04530 [Parageobacillus thermoglucosidasius]
MLNIKENDRLKFEVQLLITVQCISKQPTPDDLFRKLKPI